MGNLVSMNRLGARFSLLLTSWWLSCAVCATTCQLIESAEKRRTLPIRYEARSHNDLVVDGDMFIRSPTRGKRAAPQPYVGTSPWPNNTVYYVLDPTVTEKLKLAFQAAVAHIESHTAIRFIQRTAEEDYVAIRGDAGFKCGASHVGRIGGEQTLEIHADDECTRRGILLHELMHVLGFHHEHMRPDRDKYIEFPMGGAPRVREDTIILSFPPYDFESITHYSVVEGNLQPVDRSKLLLIRSWEESSADTAELSASDVAALNKLYPDSAGTFRPAALSHRVLPLQQNALEGYVANTVMIFPGSRQLANVTATSPEGINWHADIQPNGTGRLSIWPNTNFIGDTILHVQVYFSSGEKEELTLPVKVLPTFSPKVLQCSKIQLVQGVRSTVNLASSPGTGRVFRVSDIQAFGVQWQHITYPDGSRQLFAWPDSGFIGDGVLRLTLHFDSGELQQLSLPFGLSSTSGGGSLPSGRPL